MTPSAGRDAALVCGAAFLRSATIGVVGVVLAIYLAQLHLSTTVIGIVVGSGIAGAAAATILVGLYADAWGRRRTLIALGALAAIGYFALAAGDSGAAIVLIAFFGMVNGMGRDRGAAASLDQAILPGTAAPSRRTWVLAWYNLVLDGGQAVGALAAAVPGWLVRAGHYDLIGAHRVVFSVCGAAMLVSIVPYLALTPGVERGDAVASVAGTRRLNPDSRRLVTRLALLFGVDSLGGGFLNSALVAYWFFRRYGVSETELAALFFAARTLNAVSHVGAAWLAGRIGLVNTMVMTHLPSSLFIMAVPFAPSAAPAVALFLAREALVEMDVPTRQSYVMAVVQPEERTVASGVTNVTRNVSWAVAPSIAGAVMQQVSLAAPLFIGGTLKVAYDLVLYALFRRLRPPEEEARGNRS